MSIESTNCEFRTRDGLVFDGRMSLPEKSDPATAILIMPAIYGIDVEMEGLIEDYAKDGFLCAAPDYFHRTVPGPTADRELAFARMGNHDIEQGVDDLGDVLAQLRNHPRCNGKVAVLGFCFGGLFAYLSATRLGSDAIGAFHGTRIHSYLDEADKLTVPTSLHYGDKDAGIPLDQVSPIQDRFAGKPNNEIVVHAGAQHNFSMPLKAGFDEAVAKASRDAVVACFRSI